MASLSLSLDEIKRNMAMILGVDRTYANWDATLIDDVDRIIRSGRRRFFSANQWQFLDRDATFFTVAPQTTGTVTVVDGVVTLAGATFPSDVVDNYRISIEGTNGQFGIAVRTDSTHVTLEDTSIDADALSTYVLYKHRYEFASYFGGFRGPVTVNRNDVIEQAAVLPDFSVRALKSHEVVQTGRPKLFTSFQRQASTDIAVPAWYMEVWPFPDAVYEVNAAIRLQPGDALGADSDDEVCHPAFAECMAEAIYAQAELQMQVMNGVHEQRYNQLLGEAVERDRRMRGVRRFSPRNDGRGMPPGWEITNGTSTWAEE